MDEKCIFLVDDEPAVRSAVSQTLASIGCQVVPFSSADGCLAALLNEECDLLISDISMPGMNGLDLLKAVKKLRPALPVLLITGYGDIPTAVRAVKAGAYDFVEKPLDEETFLPLVQKALAQPVAMLEGSQMLTAAERRILELIAAGKSNKEIAYILGRSVRTVENHRYRLTQKLHADSAADLVKAAIALGLSSPSLLPE
jgi:two-component system, LuxR family, response regulator FixJ